MDNFGEWVSLHGHFPTGRLVLPQSNHYHIPLCKPYISTQTAAPAPSVLTMKGPYVVHIWSADAPADVPSFGGESLFDSHCLWKENKTLTAMPWSPQENRASRIGTFFSVANRSNQVLHSQILICTYSHQSFCLKFILQPLRVQVLSTTSLSALVTTSTTSGNLYFTELILSYIYLSNDL